MVPPVRVLVVDDDDGVRLMLRMDFEDDERFELVGEATDGLEGIELAEKHQPDLVVLDRQMPRLGGVEALPEIRKRAPGAAVILYTTEVDPTTARSALAAGALDVVDKTDPAAFIGHLEKAVMGAAADDDVAIRVGPVPAAAARCWVDSTTKILDAVVANPQVLAEPLPDDVVELFRSFLDEWGATASHGGDFLWSARAKVDDVQRVVGYWAAIDSLPDDQLEVLGVEWSPPEARPFFVSLTEGVLDALGRHQQTSRLAERLAVQWKA